MAILQKTIEMKSYRYGLPAFLCLALMLLAASCATVDDDAPVAGDIIVPEGNVAEIGAFLADYGQEHSYSTRAADINDLIPYPLDFDQSSILHLSQQTENNTAFQDENNIYSYRFVPGAVASWEDEMTYNFKAYNQTNPLEWRKIGEGGAYNGGFALYCLHFPLETAPRAVTDQGAVHYYVMPDQRKLEDLWKSDILGGYHSTPDLQSRIKFKLYHLMMYIRVRLYVPEFNPEKNTGYREGALNYGTINNVTPEFGVEWRANRRSDDDGPALTFLDGDGQIFMYQHPIPEGEEKHPVVEIPYKRYLGDNPPDQGIEGDYDRVRVYDFSVIIPQQKGMVNEDGQTGSYSESDFLNFYFTTNAGAQARYFFNSTMRGVDTQPDDVSNLELKQGNFQYIELYVPRVGSELIFMGAQVKDWDQRGTEMILRPEETE